MNPLFIFAVLVVVAGAGGYGGWRVAMDHRDALELAEAQGKAQALEATAKEIAKIDVRNVTIRQQGETIIKEKPIYQECKNTPEMMGVINKALTGGAP